MMMKKSLIIEPCPVCGCDPVVTCLMVPVHHIYCNNDNCKFNLMVSGEGRLYTVKCWNKQIKKYRKKVKKHETNKT